jgi:hypothetical protein
VWTHLRDKDKELVMARWIAVDRRSLRSLPRIALAAVLIAGGISPAAVAQAAAADPPPPPPPAAAPEVTPPPPAAAAAAAAPAAAAAAAPAAATPAAPAAAAPAPPPGGDPALAACRGEALLPSSQKLARIQGVIIAPEVEELHHVQLALKDQGTSNHWIVSRFERCPEGNGRFAYAIDVPPGTYDLTLRARDYETETVSGLAIEANHVKQQGFSLVKGATQAHPAVLWLPVVFLLSIWLIRWNNIAKPSRLEMIARISDLKACLQAGSPNWNDLHAAQQEMERKWSVLDWLFWSRGHEIASWSVVHRTELGLLEEAPPARVNARLASAEQRLAEIDKAAAKSLAERIGAELKCDAAKVDDGARRQLLIEATRYIYNAGDTDFAALTSWQNKSFWLTMTGVGLICALGIAEGHIPLFIAGAVGGFLSRLTRELKRADVKSDYGASWSPLFLSPVAGAISGWFGVALIMLLTDPNVGVLGGPLKVIGWDSDNLAATLAAAFVLGFSERLFDRMVSQLEESIDKKKEVAQKAATQTPATREGRAPAAAGARGGAAGAPVPAPAAGTVAVAVPIASVVAGGLEPPGPVAAESG